jgi:hypothetical protein
MDYPAGASGRVHRQPVLEQPARHDKRSPVAPLQLKRISRFAGYFDRQDGSNSSSFTPA